MRKKKVPGSNGTRSVKDSRFPASIFIAYLGTLCLMSGLHTGLVLLMEMWKINPIWETYITLLYWILVAAGLPLYTRWQIRKYYEKPMHELADATRRVAEGDFSVYVPPTHTSDKLDYLDVMLEDFNKMVGELGNVETLKTDFFSNVSHEMKTPLARIQNNAELLRKEDLTEKQAKYADTIYFSSKRLANLIENMLKLNKLEKQTILPKTETYDLCAQLAECALNYEELWEQRELEVEAELEDSVEITADPALMELVWNNLLSNAMKYTEPGGSVRLVEMSDQKEIRVAVQDTGCGMTEETKRHIFEKFYQGDTSHAAAGNGLGLPLALRILQLNGFQIEVESEPGVGSTFTVVIPKEDE